MKKFRLSSFKHRNYCVHIFLSLLALLHTNFSLSQGSQETTDTAKVVNGILVIEGVGLVAADGRIFLGEIENLSSENCARRDFCCACKCCIPAPEYAIEGFDPLLNFDSLEPIDSSDLILIEGGGLLRPDTLEYFPALESFRFDDSSKELDDFDINSLDVKWMDFEAIE